MNTSTLRRWLSEDALLLRSYGKNVCQPVVRDVPRDNGSREIPIRDEMQICEAFARLSSLVDCGGRVMAVALEFGSSLSGMAVCVTSNEGNLGPVLEALRRVAKHLEVDATRKINRQESTSSFFELVVDLEIKRILGRLRSSHASAYSTKIGMSFIPRLKAVFDTKPTIDISQPALASKLRKDLTDLEKCFKRLENTAKCELKEVRAIVAEIVQRCSDLLKDDRLLHFLTQRLDKEACKNTMRNIQGIGQYYSISKDLVGAARKYSEYFKAISIYTVPRSTRSIGFSRDSIASINELQNRLRVPEIPPTVVKNYSEQRLKGLKRPKVHAEVQLLFHFDSLPIIRRPRVICSSKDACFLCYILFGIHQGYLIPRSHGKIYPAWILPTFESGTHAQGKVEALAIEIEKQMQEAIRQRSLRPRKDSFPDPKESTPYLRRPFPSVTTIKSLSRAETVFTIGGVTSSTSPITPAPKDRFKEYYGRSSTASVDTKGRIGQPASAEALSNSDIESLSTKCSNTAAKPSKGLSPLNEQAHGPATEVHDCSSASIQKPEKVYNGMAGWDGTLTSSSLSNIGFQSGAVALKSSVSIAEINDADNRSCEFATLTASAEWQSILVPNCPSQAHVHSVSANTTRVKAPGIFVHVDGHVGRNGSITLQDDANCSESSDVMLAKTPLQGDRSHCLRLHFRYCETSMKDDSPDAFVFNANSIPHGGEVTLEHGGVLSDKKLALLVGDGCLLLHYSIDAIDRSRSDP